MAGKTQMGDLTMTREEAIKKIKEAMPTMWKDTKEAIQTVIPELFENKNEMMVRRIESFLSAYGLDYFAKDELLEVENWLEKQKLVPINPDDKHMLDRIMALVEFCNDKEIIWSWLCEKAKVATQKSVEWDKLQEDFRNINEAFEDGKKEVVDNPERYGLCRPAEQSKEGERIRVVLCDIVPYMETELCAHGLTVEKVLDYLENQSHDGKKWLTPEQLHRIEQLRYEAGFDAGVRSEAEKRKEEKPSIFPPGLGEVRWNPISSVQQKPTFNVGDTIMAKARIPDEYVKKFKALCDGYEIKLPNREYDIYHLCEDLAELFGNTDKQEPSSYDHEMWKNCEANFEGGKKEVIEHPEKYGLMKNQPPKVNIGHFKSFMMQYLQEAANRKDDSEIEADTDKWAIKLLSLVDAEAVNPVCLDEDTELGLDRALQVVKSAKGNLQGYQSDDGIYECDHAIGVLENILNDGIVQKVTEWNEEDEKVIKKVCNFLEANRIKCGLELISMSDITRLNNLRYKYAWKPDDTDMGYLKSIIDRVPLTCREQGALERIYNGLVSH